MVGANWQPTPLWVLGLQGDVGTTGLDTELNIPAAGGNLIDAQPDLTASASVRLGFVPMSATMLYVIGGYSYAHYNVNTSFLGNFDEDYNGFHVGCGIETKLTHHLTGRIEYRYTQYDGEDWGTGGFLNVEPSSHTGTVKRSWPVPGRPDSHSDGPTGRLAPQGASVRSDPHSDRPAVSFPGPVDRPGTPCGEALPRRCL